MSHARQAVGREREGAEDVKERGRRETKNVERGRKEWGVGEGGRKGRREGQRGTKKLERGREVRKEGRREKREEMGWKMEPRVHMHTYDISVCSMHQYACLCTVRQLATTDHWLLVYIQTNLT